MAKTKGSWRRTLEGKIFVFYSAGSTTKFKESEEKLNKIILLTKAGQYRIIGDHSNHTLNNVLINLDGQGVVCVIRKYDRALRDIVDPKPFGSKIHNLTDLSPIPDPDAVEESFYLHTKYRARFRNNIILEKEEYESMNRAIRENDRERAFFLCEISSSAFAENQYKSRLYIVLIRNKYLLVPFREPHGIRTVFYNYIIEEYRKDIHPDIRKKLVLHEDGQLSLKEGVVLASL